MTSAAHEPERDMDRLDRFLRVELAILIFVIVLALFPFVRDPAVDTKILIYTWGGGVLAVTCVLGRAWLRRPLDRPALLIEILLAFYVWLALATGHAVHVGYATEELSKFVALLLIYGVASQAYHTAEQVQRLMLVTCAAVALSVVYGIFQHFGIDPFPWNPDLTSALKEAPGTFGNGNLAAHTTVLCIVMAVYLALSRKRVWYLGFVVLFLVHMNLANQRGGIVGLAAAGALVGLAVLVYRRIRRPLPAIAVSFVALALLAVVGLAGVMGILKLRTGISYPTTLPILLRYHGYSGASKLIMERPVLGWGPGNYRYENPRVWTPFEQEHFAVKHKMNYRAHNDTLEIGTEAGLPAAALYLTFLIAATCCGLWMGLTATDRAKRLMGFAFAAFFAAFMVDGGFGFNLRSPVSATLLFLMAGAFEGFWLGASGAPPRAIRGRAGSAVMALVCVLVAATIGFQTLLFASQFVFQRAAGAIYYKAYPEAETFLTQAERLAPWNWEFAYQRGEIALRQYQPQQAIDNLERARALNPYFPPILVSLGHAQLMMAEIGAKDQPMGERMKMLDAAEACAKQALQICAPLPEGEDMLGRVASLRATFVQQEAGGDGAPQPQATELWREAEQHLSKAIAYKPKEVDRAYAMLARARMMLNDKVGAQDALVRAVNANPTNTSVWTQFKQFADASGQNALFREMLRTAVTKLRANAKDLPPGLEALAMAWGGGEGGMLQGTAVLAKAAAAQSAKRGGPPPKDNFVWAADALLSDMAQSGVSRDDAALPTYNLSVVYAAAGQWEKTVGLLNTSYPNLPENQRPDAAVLLAQVLSQLNQGDKAVTVLRDAALQAGGNLRLQAALARTLANNGRTAEARNEYDLILSQFQLNERDRDVIARERAALNSGQ